MDQQIVPYQAQDVAPRRERRGIARLMDNDLMDTPEGVRMWILMWNLVHIPDRRREDHKGTRKRARHNEHWQ